MSTPESPSSLNRFSVSSAYCIDPKIGLTQTEVSQTRKRYGFIEDLGFVLHLYLPYTNREHLQEDFGKSPNTRRGRS